VIVRIAGESQWEFPDDQADQLNQLDNNVVAAVDAGDEAQFKDLWGKMLELVRSSGKPVDDEELVASDVIFPPADITLAEAAHEFTGEGLIPD
jgi:hypothetical protein